MRYNIARGSGGRNDFFHPLKPSKRQKGFSRKRIKKSLLILSPIVALAKAALYFPRGYLYFALQCSSQFKTVKKLMFLNSLTEDPNKNASEQKFSKDSWRLNRS